MVLSLLIGLIQASNVFAVDEIELCGFSKAYGNYRYGDRSHVAEVVFYFLGIKGDVPIRFEVWDNDYVKDGEKIEILINGNSVGFAPQTGDVQWSEFHEIVLSDALVNDDKKNILVFNAVKNPPKNWTWAVRNVHIKGSVCLAWDANTEPDLAGYNIYYGTASGDYSEPIDVGDVTEFILMGLKRDMVYFLAAKAYDEDDNESAYSEELIYSWHKKPNAAGNGKIKILKPWR